MVIDEIGYLPISRTGAQRFEEWGEVFGDEVMAAALIDRLLHYCHIVNIRGNSYRMRQPRELAHRLATAQPRPTPPRHRPECPEISR